MLRAMSVLNASLYEDQDAYWQAITGLLEQDPATRTPTPQAVKDVSTAILSQFVEIGRWEKIFNKYGLDIVESMSIGYRLIVNEDWSGFDVKRAVGLMDDSLRATQATRERLGTPQISLDNVDNRLTVMMFGLATNAPEGAPLRDYVLEQPPYQRVDSFADLILGMGGMMAGPKKRHAQAFEQLQGYAWRTGLGLGVLDVMGEVPHHDRWGEPASDS